MHVRIYCSSREGMWTKVASPTPDQQRVKCPFDVHLVIGKIASYL